MAEIHEALKTLSPTEHHTFPSESSALDVHLVSSLTDTHKLISSIPPPANLPSYLSLPDPPNTDIAALQKEWKPVKLSPKDNPLDISMFKLTSKDGHGSWFARRSIHTDIPFSRIKAGLQKEFHEPHAPDSSVTGPIRGIGKETSVPTAASDLGRAEVVVLSAQFPGPSAPRIFVEGYLSSSAHAEDLSDASKPSDIPAASKDRPQQFTIISKPVLNYPDAGLESRPGHVLGSYESVEFIREIIPAAQLKHSQSSPSVASLEAVPAPTPPTRLRGKTMGSSDVPPVGLHAAVEWIMVTRSDAGGSVPKWMVERGTPNAVVKDAEKFLKWCKEAEYLEEALEGDVEATQKEAEHGKSLARSGEFREKVAETRQMRKAAEGTQTTEEEGTATPVPKEADTRQHMGLFASALSSVTAGMGSLATSAVSAASSSHFTPPETEGTLRSSRETTPTSGDTDDTISDSASNGTFTTALSAEDPEYPREGTTSSRTSSLTPSLTPTNSAKTPTPEDRALSQFLKDKTKLGEKLARDAAKRNEMEHKALEKHLKNLEKRERKYRRAVEKSDERKRKEMEKNRECREKAVGAGMKEVKELKKIVEGLTRENLELRKRVEELEAERESVRAVMGNTAD